MSLEDFHFICDIIPDQENNKINEFEPQNRYYNQKGLKRHIYGNGSFCKFKIPNHYKKGGVYIITVDDQPKYVGECKCLSARYNSGYGNISPRNCFTRGQPTNCRINKAILEEAKKGKQIKLLFKETTNRFSLEAELIQKLNPEWNKTRGKSIQETKKNKKINRRKKVAANIFPYKNI